MEALRVRLRLRQDIMSKLERLYLSMSGGDVTRSKRPKLSDAGAPGGSGVEIYIGPFMLVMF